MIRLFEGKEHATLYRNYRPRTSALVVSEIRKFMEEGNLHPHNGIAVDVGCGSGQHTVMLAPHFSRVYGYDISPVQIQAACEDVSVPANVTYGIATAEKLPNLADQSVDLVTGCLSFHWLDLPVFYAEVDRVLRPGGTVAAVGQVLCGVNHPTRSGTLNRIMDSFIEANLKPRYHEKLIQVFSGYRNLPVPYPNEVRLQGLIDETPQTVAYMLGYFSSWSCFQTMYNEDPVNTLALLEKLKDDFLKTMEVSTSPEDTPLILRNEYFLVLCRKPVV